MIFFFVTTRTTSWKVGDPNFLKLVQKDWNHWYINVGLWNLQKGRHFLIFLRLWENWRMMQSSRLSMMLQSPSISMSPHFFSVLSHIQCSGGKGSNMNFFKWFCGSFHCCGICISPSTNAYHNLNPKFWIVVVPPHYQESKRNQKSHCRINCYMRWILLSQCSFAKQVGCILTNSTIHT